MSVKVQSGPSTPLGTSVRSLSERAQGILHRLLDQQTAPDSIARVLYLQTRESVTPAAITRYASRYRKRQQEKQQVREKLDGFIARAQKDGIAISDLLRALLIQKFSLAQRDGTLKKLGLLELEAAERRRGEYDLKQKQAQVSAQYRQRELELKERQAKLAERRFRLEREKAQAMLNQLDRKASSGKPLTQEDVRHFRAIYGLYDDDPAKDSLETEPDNGNAEETEK